MTLKASALSDVGTPTELPTLSQQRRLRIQLGISSQSEQLAEAARAIIECPSGKEQRRMIAEASDDVLEETIRALLRTKRKKVLLAMVRGVHAGRFGK